MKSIAVFNNKGGVGKSTLTYHLGCALSELGVKTLLVDLDPQSNLTLFGLEEDQLENIWESEDLFIEDFDSARKSLGQDKFTEYQKLPHSIHYTLKPIEDGLYDKLDLPTPISLLNNLGLMPGRISLHMYENKISKLWSEAFLGEPQALRTITAIRDICNAYATKYGYDIALIDTSPSLGALNKVIISTVDSFIIPCAPDMFSDYGIRNIGNSLKLWRKELDTMFKLLPESKRKLFPEKFVQLLGYTIYNAKKTTKAPNELKVAKAHHNFAEKIPNTIKEFIPPECYVAFGEDAIMSSIADNVLIHSHNTLPTMAQKYKTPMWAVPDCTFEDLEDKSTVSGNAQLFRETREKYIQFANAVLSRLEKL